MIMIRSDGGACGRQAPDLVHTGIWAVIRVIGLWRRDRFEFSGVIRRARGVVFIPWLKKSKCAVYVGVSSDIGGYLEDLDRLVDARLGEGGWTTVSLYEHNDDWGALRPTP
jgi:hypothetical protein